MSLDNGPYFKGIVDRFKGTTIDTSIETCDQSSFLEKLNGTMLFCTYY